MSESKALFRNALTQAVCADYSFVPTENEIEHSFSQSFRQKIEKIKVRNEFFISAKAKKAFALIAAVILLITLVSCTIPAVREKIQNYFIATYSYYFNISWKTGEAADNMNILYAPSHIPDGYRETDRESNTERVIIVYERNQPDCAYAKIIFTQSLISDDGVKLNKEYGKPDIVELDGITALVQSNSTRTIIYAEYKGYLFTAECSENAESADALEMLNTLKELK